MKILGLGGLASLGDLHRGQKKFLASMEVVEAGEAGEAKNFQKKSMAQNA